MRVVRAGETTDWSAILSLLQRAFAYMTERIAPPSSLTRLDAEGVRAKAASEICLLAEQDNTITGCVFCEIQPAGVLYIGKLAVEPARQGHGIGRTLLEAAEAEARSRGLIFLRLQTRIELTENHAAFARMGFVRTGETAHPGFDRPTSVTMEKRL